MSQQVRILAKGAGWSAADIVCTATVGERPFEEEHGSFCIAVVTRGTFCYRTRQGTAVMTPGALLLGNARACFECGHEHSNGDHCLSFQFSPEMLEEVLADVPGAKHCEFDAPNLPARPVLAALLVDAEVACRDGDADELEEVALRLAGATATMLTGLPGRPAKISQRDEKRIADAIRLIEGRGDEHLSLSELADRAATSPYHFLRSFRTIVGVTPYQFLLRTRLHRAAVRLRLTTAAVSEIAFEAGFGDLSTFNRRFRRVMGQTPSGYRQSGQRIPELRRLPV
ncbi:MAG TPA: AraC family transcriptional regulator [Mesorhizobium sp.]|jgi:AraC-like DNA-binding protein|uniref:helix-turn-helix transcriptional regulator n=1 Tax=Mesorhizobium sp. TaxID=1871066 RepID=UPI002DDCD14E|nr:AraC family transcriptional regulator [Mesorhizobium sp.]HEV2504358.1 AraC family transcriptional regulator [Mesorhizobium sp.]